MQGGIDEAGRGPVLGPLVVAGVAADRDALVGLGVRDSKKLTPAKRERIARLLLDDPAVRVAVRVVDAEVLDAEREHRSLNHIELVRFQEIADELGVDHVIVDAADVDAARFGRRIMEAVPHVTVQSEHRADDRHPEVAAASVVAKVTRDRLVSELARRLERKLAMPLGSGYPSDPKTRAFLAAYLDAHGDVPEGTRRSWKTVDDLLKRAAGPVETRLDAF